MKTRVREFQAEDAERLSRLVIRTLRTVSSQEYSQGAIEALVPFFAPGKLLEKASSQYMIVCVDGGELVGVASLDRDRVRNVFVSADMQRRGIGRTLMANIESVARGRGLERIYLHSALSAQSFYEAIGFRAMASIDRELDGFPLPEIEMEKDLTKGRPAS